MPVQSLVGIVIGQVVRWRNVSNWNVAIFWVQQQQENVTCNCSGNLDCCWLFGKIKMIFEEREKGKLWHAKFFWKILYAKNRQKSGREFDDFIFPSQIKMFANFQFFGSSSMTHIGRHLLTVMCCRPRKGHSPSPNKAHMASLKVS